MKVTKTSHPAKFSDTVLTAITTLGKPRGGRVLDPCAGVGRVHLLAEPLGIETVGVEIEPEWAAAHPRTIVGDATALPFATDSFDGIITSPVYGNRMSDHHDAKERCKKCDGEGMVNVEAVTVATLVEMVCPRCKGKGQNDYRRNTYRHHLNRIDPETGRPGPLHPNNVGRYQWGTKYQQLQAAIWNEVARVLRPGGTFVLNVSDHIRANAVMPVTKWHLDYLASIGFTVTDLVPVATPRNGHGQNRDARMPNEWVVALESAGG